MTHHILNMLMSFILVLLHESQENKKKLSLISIKPLIMLDEIHPNCHIYIIYIINMKVMENILYHQSKCNIC